MFISSLFHFEKTYFVTMEIESSLTLKKQKKNFTESKIDEPDFWRYIQNNQINAF